MENSWQPALGPELGVHDQLREGGFRANATLIVAEYRATDGRFERVRCRGWCRKL